MNSKYSPVMKKAGKYSPEVKSALNKSGVYLVFTRSGALVYIGMSQSNLYKTISRHFQSWNDPRQKRTTYAQGGGYKVRIIFTTKAQAPRLERSLIIKLRPRDNPDKFDQYTLEDLTPSQSQELNRAIDEHIPF